LARPPQAGKEPEKIRFKTIRSAVFSVAAHYTVSSNIAAGIPAAPQRINFLQRGQIPRRQMEFA